MTEQHFCKIQELLFGDKTDHKPMYLFKMVQMSFYDFHHVGCDLIQVFDGTDIVCKQCSATLMQYERQSCHFVRQSRGKAHIALKLMFTF